MSTLFMKVFAAILIPLFLLGTEALSAQAQAGDREEIPERVSLSLDEAIQIALVNNYMLRQGLLDIDIANAQIREAWGTVYPQINASGEYTRNLRTPNPFAGSDAGGLFDTFGALEWLAFNESARTDGDDTTNPIPLDEFFDRQRQGYQEAGLTPPGQDGSNPFAVENQFNAGISVSQAIYNGAAFAAIRGARQFRKLSENQFEAERQSVVNEVKNSFYSALLAKEQLDVLQSSVDRLQKTVEETRRSVEAGVLSKYDRISAEVELVNLETNLIEVENQAELAVKNLALQLGIPTRTTVELVGSLDADGANVPETLDPELAWELASQQRPDLALSEGRIDILNVEREITRAGFLPTLNAFASASYIGSVPSNRTQVNPIEGEDFSFEARDRGFFDRSYWEPAVAVGLSLNWNIFNGFQTSMQMQQNQIEIKKAEIDREFQENAIYLEIEQAIRSVETALKRIRSQERNIERAELNYEFARTRLQEGTGTSLEERQASSLLDESRLNYLSAVYDYLTALSEYERALGNPVIRD
ncbi:MAG: TolC family protein [Balneolaceae bacterium]|nr:TolC family protein [Balneolaceae bacterium]MCH8548582.1 TolC family protein [Balneolaceae bacterium]